MSGETPQSGRRTARRDERSAAGASQSHCAPTSRRAFLRAAGASAIVSGAGTGLATAQTATPAEQAPFDGPHEVPCLIPAAHFDRGGEGVAYHEASPEESYGDYRDASVDTQPSPEGGHYVGWIEAGEWWEYTVEVPESGYHALSVRIATVAAEPGITVAIDGEEVPTPYLDLDVSGTWQSWLTADVGGTVEFTAGEHVIRVRADAGGWNFKWLELGRSEADVPGVDPSGREVATLARSDTSVTLDWEYDLGTPQPRTLEAVGDGTTAEVSGSPPLTFDGLDPDAEYTVREPESNFERTVRTLPAGADDRPPLAPSEFTVEPEQTPRIDVSWRPARDLGGSGVHHYDVYLDGDLARTLPATSTSASFVDPIEEGETYEVSLVAVDAFGNESERLTETVSTGESAPTGVPAAPRNLSTSSRGPTDFSVDWEPPADDLASYEVRWRDARSEDAVPDGTEPRSGTHTLDAPADDTGVPDPEPGVPYRVAVRAVDRDGHVSDWASVTGRTEPGPTDFRVADVEGDALTLAWDLPWAGGDGRYGLDLTSFEVAVEGEVVETVDAATDSATLPAFGPEVFTETSVAGVAASGERTTEQRALVSAQSRPTDAADGAGRTAPLGGDPTYLGPDVSDYAAAWLGEEGTHSLPERSTAVSVRDGTVWIRGHMLVGSTDSDWVYVTAARFEGDTLRVTVDASGGGDDALGTIDYQVGLGVDRRPTQVVVDHVYSQYAGTWQDDSLDATLVLPTKRRHLGDEEPSTGGALLLSGWTGELSSGRIEVRADHPAIDGLFLDAPADADHVTVENEDRGAVVTIDAPDGVDPFADVERRVARSEPRLDDALLLGDIEVYTDPEGHGHGTVEVADATLTTADGRSLDLGTAPADLWVSSDRASVGPPDTDLNHDGLYDDLTGNGEIDLGDAVELYQDRDSSHVTESHRYYDYSGNGEVDLADVVQLFQENAG